MFRFFSKRSSLLQTPIATFSDHIDNPPIICREETSLQKAIELMNEHYIGSILVENRNNKIVGIFTERDLLYKVAPIPNMKLAETSVVEYMTPGPDMIKKTEPLSVALDMMRNRNHRHLVLTDEHDRFEKVISIKDVLYYLCDVIQTL